MEDAEGKPEGFEFPNSSLAVRETEIEEPEATEAADAVTEDSARE
jgi:hypothetical protein